MQNFELPTNIKQIGSIDSGLRIYVEDYVFTYIQQYTLAGGNNERLAMLVGRYITIDSQPVLFISGAIAGKYCIEEKGSLEFSDKSYEYILDKMDKHFPALEAVGWVQSQPGYGTYLSSKYYNYHTENYPNHYQVLFVTDPVQRLNAFYVYDDKMELNETKGYFVYYDKNKPMHDYMLESKAISVKSQKAEDNADEDIEVDEPDDMQDEEMDSIEKVAVPRPIRIRTVAKKNNEIDVKRRQLVRKRRTATEQKRMVNMMTGLCAVMFLVCFVMGAGLIRSEDRIGVLEQNMATLSTAYRNRLAGTDQAQSAFAPAENETDVAGTDTAKPVGTGVVVVENGNVLLDAENALAAQAQAFVQDSLTATPAPSEVAAATPAEIPETYTVQQGDNLLHISKKFYGSKNMVDKIMEVNKLSDPDKIFFGKVLILPRP